MAIKRFKSSSAITGTKSSKMWDQTTTLNDYQSISKITVLSAEQSSITFSNIPQNYTHLQIRGIARTNVAATDLTWLFMQLGNNGSIDISATNYSQHGFESYNNTSTNGTQIYVSTSTDHMVAGATTSAGQLANSFGAIIIDILDYTSTKNKIIKAAISTDTGNSPEWKYVGIHSGAWRSSNAITDIKLYPYTGNLVQYTSFALYGIRTA